MLDIKENRRAQKWQWNEQVARVLWALAYPVFRLSPRPLWGWRRWLLRRFGARVGREVHVHPTARITMPWNLTLGDFCAVGDRATLYALGQIRIGPRVTVSQGAHLCAGGHDITDPARRLTKPPIQISADAWVCADAFVGPGVVIGERAIVAARAVTMRSVPEGRVAIGNPATLSERPAP
jgi:putative colanic acid biosynthesis acetyltransferase WcaF